MFKSRTIEYERDLRTAISLKFNKEFINIQRHQFQVSTTYQLERRGESQAQYHALDSVVLLQDRVGMEFIRRDEKEPNDQFQIVIFGVGALPLRVSVTTDICCMTGLLLGGW